MFGRVAALDGATLRPVGPLAVVKGTVDSITLNKDGVATAKIQLNGRIFDTFTINTDRVKPGTEVQITIELA